MSAFLVLLRGLPGTGKSTLARRLAPLLKARTQIPVRHLEADFKTYDADGRFEGSRVPGAHRWCLAQAIRSMDQGIIALVANTFTEEADLAEYVIAARQRNLAVHILEARGNFVSTHAVPDSTLQHMRNRYWSIGADQGAADPAAIPGRAALADVLRTLRSGATLLTVDAAATLSAVRHRRGGSFHVVAAVTPELTMPAAVRRGPR